MGFVKYVNTTIRGKNMKCNENHNRKVSFSPLDIAESEITEVMETLRSSWITTGD